MIMTFSLKASGKHTISFADSPSMTEQSHAKSCDIHHIMKRYERNKTIEHVNAHQGTYLDYIGAPDFQEKEMMIAEAKSMFETVPSKIREEFSNDPAQFIAFMQDNKNVEAIEELGLDASHLRQSTAQSSEEQIDAFSSKVAENVTQALSEQNKTKQETKQEN